MKYQIFYGKTFLVAIKLQISKNFSKYFTHMINCHPATNIHKASHCHQTTSIINHDFIILQGHGSRIDSVAPSSLPS